MLFPSSVTADAVPPPPREGISLIMIKGVFHTMAQVKPRTLSGFMELLAPAGR